METKLYFQPENYGRKKQKKKLHFDNDQEQGNTHRLLKVYLFVLGIVTLFLLMLWLTRGKTTVSGGYPDNIRSDSLECISTEIDYAKIGRTSALEKELKLNLIFRDEAELSSIAVKDTLTFASQQDARNAEAVAHATLYAGLAAIGYQAETFSNKFSIFDNKLVLSLRGAAAEINEYTKDYFLITTDAIPSTLSEYRSLYESAGFKCTSTKDNQ